MLMVEQCKLQVGLVDARPRLERKTAVVGLRSTTRHGDAPARVGLVGGPS